jgi:hypothetical protein
MILSKKYRVYQPSQYGPQGEQFFEVLEEAQKHKLKLYAAYSRFAALPVLEEVQS